MTLAPAERQARLAAEEADILVGLAFEHLGLPFEHTRAIPEEERAAWYLTAAQRAGQVPGDVTLAQFRRFLRVMATNIVARATYIARPYDGPAWLYRTTDPATTNDTFGLSAVIGGGLHVRDVGGTHFELMSRPQVLTLAARLAADLDAVAPPPA